MNHLLRSLFVIAFSSLFFFFSCEKKVPSKTLTLQPAQNPTEVHIFGGEGIDQSTPGAPEILGGAGTYYGSPVFIRAALKFDMSAIPNDAIIQSAKLTLYSNPTPLNGQEGNANSGLNNALLIQRIVDSWTASQVNWTNQPAVTTSGEIVVPHTSESFKDIKDLDVTDLVKKMHNSGNFGFLIRLQTEQPYNFRIFCSSKYTDATKHPKLEIKYKED
ncbi:MAG: DNRLRE domain-containing protein [Chitinophagaceae bacterium]|nr:DNRLRE domain-containing protein [Chitinophagaceae bacterium]